MIGYTCVKSMENQFVSIGIFGERAIMGNAKGRSDSQFYALEEKDLIASIKCSEI
jgi:hypothetical protein